MQTTNAGSRSTSPRSGDEEEAQLVRRIACQDRHAFELLYRIYYRRLTRFLDRVTRRPQMIDEILDDTMLVVRRKAATFNGASQVSTWLFAIAYRKAMKTFKREDSFDLDEAASAPSPETALLEGEWRSDGWSPWARMACAACCTPPTLITTKSMYSTVLSRPSIFLVRSRTRSSPPDLPRSASRTSAGAWSRAATSTRPGALLLRPLDSANSATGFWWVISGTDASTLMTW